MQSKNKWRGWNSPQPLQAASQSMDGGTGRCGQVVTRGAVLELPDTLASSPGRSGGWHRTPRTSASKNPPLAAGPKPMLWIRSPPPWKQALGQGPGWLWCPVCDPHTQASPELLAGAWQEAEPKDALLSFNTSIGNNAGAGTATPHGRTPQLAGRPPRHHPYSCDTENRPVR